MTTTKIAKYPVIDRRIQRDLCKRLKSYQQKSLSDAYVKFFRWAIDRLQGRDGIVCFVTNNSFVDQIAFDGMRKHLLEDFTQVYHLDLHGNVRKNPKLSGTTHNVFGIQVGVGITIAVRLRRQQNEKLIYYRVPEYLAQNRETWLFLLRGKVSEGLEWQELQPDEKHTWLTEGMHSEFATFLANGNKRGESRYKA